MDDDGDGLVARASNGKGVTELVERNNNHTFETNEREEATVAS